MGQPHVQHSGDGKLVQDHREHYPNHYDNLQAWLPWEMGMWRKTNKKYALGEDKINKEHV